MQVTPQLLDLVSWTFGEHADRAHADHDLAGRMDDGGNLDSIPGEADVNVRHPPVSRLSGQGEVREPRPFLPGVRRVGLSGWTGWRSDGNFGDAALSLAELTAQYAGAAVQAGDLLLPQAGVGAATVAGAWPGTALPS